jgi:CubicO group peptidase (beta-lactamase class C family)
MIHALLFAAAVAAASAGPVGPSLDAQLARLVGDQALQTRALEVAVARDGSIVYNHGFGEASADTRFPIASITKMFTAVAIMQLVQDHRVDLGANVATYLPNAPYAKEITVRQLLQHTSGLWNYADYAFQTGIASRPTTPQAILAMAAKHPLTSTPGKKWSYSNTGYVVLGLIVERVSGEPLAQYERDRIFRPAGMTQTTVGNPPAGASVAEGYMSATGNKAPAYDPSWLFACGDIVSTAADLARFDIALLDGKLLAPATFAQMQANPVSGENGMQGLGVDMMRSQNLQFVGHHGGVPGYETENELIPVEHVAWVVLSDTFDFGTPRADRVVVSTLFPNAAATQATASAEDPAITERFREALSSLLKGNIDRSQYTAQVNAALTPDLLARTAAQLKSLGRIANIAYLGSSKIATGTLYSYRVTFSAGQTLTWQFLLDPTGKIAGIGSSG